MQRSVWIAASITAWAAALGRDLWSIILPETELPETRIADRNEKNGLVNEVVDVIVNAVNLHHLQPESVTAETSLRDGGLELDSIDILEVVVAIEHHFGVKVGDAEVAREHFRTIGKIAEYVQSLKSAG